MSKILRHHNYKINLYSGGHVEYITPCPNGIEGKYTHDLIMVGSLACQRCQYHHHIEFENQSVACGFKTFDEPGNNKFKIKQIKQNEKKDFYHPAIV